MGDLTGCARVLSVSHYGIKDKGLLNCDYKITLVEAGYRVYDFEEEKDVTKDASGIDIIVDGQ